MLAVYVFEVLQMSFLTSVLVDRNCRLLWVCQAFASWRMWVIFILDCRCVSDNDCHNLAYEVKLLSPGCIIGSNRSLLRSLIMLSVSESCKQSLLVAQSRATSTENIHILGAVILLISKALWHRTFQWKSNAHIVTVVFPCKTIATGNYLIEACEIDPQSSQLYSVMVSIDTLWFDFQWLTSSWWALCMFRYRILCVHLRFVRPALHRPRRWFISYVIRIALSTTNMFINAFSTVSFVSIWCYGIATDCHFLRIQSGRISFRTFLLTPAQTWTWNIRWTLISFDARLQSSVQSILSVRLVFHVINLHGEDRDSDEPDPREKQIDLRTLPIQCSPKLDSSGESAYTTRPSNANLHVA